MKNLKTRWTEVWKEVVRVFSLLGERIDSVRTSLNPEGPEVVSIFASLSWLVPLTVNPWFLSLGPLNKSVLQGISPDLLLFGFLILFVYQTLALLFGGIPSVFIRNERSRRAGLLVRRAGLWGGVWMWLFIVVRVSGMVITPGTGLYFFMALYTFYGVVRINRMLQIDALYKKTRTLYTTMLKEDRNSSGGNLVPSKG